MNVATNWLIAMTTMEERASTQLDHITVDVQLVTPELVSLIKMDVLVSMAINKGKGVKGMEEECIGINVALNTLLASIICLFIIEVSFVRNHNLILRVQGYHITGLCM